MSDSNASEQLNALIDKYSPSLSRDMLVQAVAQSLSNAAHNAAFAQLQHDTIINVNTAQGTTLLQTIGASFVK